MVTFLSGGTGTPKVLAGTGDVFPADETTVVANTGDDVVLGGSLVCPDLDTVLYLGGGLLDRDTWWGIDGDSMRTHEELSAIAEASDLEPGPRYLSAEAQTGGREIGRWRRFSAVAEFMHIGDRDRAVHLTRTGLVDQGRTLTEATGVLADAFDLDRTLLPMSDDPVATLVHTPDGVQHFQEWWVAHGGKPPVDDVEFRGAQEATLTPAVRRALADEVVVGPSNPVTSIGPMLAIPGFEDALANATVVAVSPFVDDEVFSGPADQLMAATGREPSTGGVSEAYPFVDAFVVDENDRTDLDRPAVMTDTRIADESDAARVGRAAKRALEGAA